MNLDPVALRAAVSAATSVRPPEFGGTTPLDQVPAEATRVAIETYLRETGRDS